MKITARQITNTAYEREHDKAPRGLGLWAVEVRYMDGSKVLVWASQTMNLGEAKKELAEKLSQDNKPILWVSVAP